MARLAFLLAGLLWLSPAFALSTSDRAFRIEDKREGNVVLGAEQAKIEAGEIYKTVLLLWGRLDVYGEVDEVVVLSGKAVFHEGAKLNKSLVVMGGSFESLPGADVAAERVSARAPGPFWRLLRSAGVMWRENFDGFARFLSGLTACLLLWFLGWGLFAAFPSLQKTVVDSLVAEGAKNFFAGLFGTLLTPIFGVGLVVSLVGIALLPLFFMLLVLAALISYLSVAFWVGHRLWPAQAGKKIRPLSLLLGLLALQLFWSVPVWWSSLPVLFLWTLAWGSLLRGLRKVWK